MSNELKRHKKSDTVKYVIIIVCCILAVALISSVLISVSSALLPHVNTYTVSADTYANLKRFSYWQDEDGKEVSDENPYVYESEKELDLTAVYEDFIDFDIVLSNPAEEGYAATYYDEESYTVRDCFWFNTARLTVPLKYGMTIEFVTDKAATQILFGLSEKERAFSMNAYAWNPAFPYLFIPEYNYYSGFDTTVKESLGYLGINNSGATGDKTFFENLSTDFVYNVADTKVRLVLDDTLLLYINDELVTADNMIAYDIDPDKDYYFTFAATESNMQLTDFGYDDYVYNRGKLNDENIVNSPVDKSYYAGQNLTLFGDSITYGVGASSNTTRYSTVLASDLGMTEHNFGISSTVYCTGHPSRTSRLNDVNDLPLNSDVIIVLLGVNDFDNCIKGQFAELGELGDDDTSTIYGAAKAMYSALIKRFRCTGAEIYVCTPVITSWNNSVSAVRDWSQDKKNACGYTLPQMCSVIKETATYYGLVTLNLNALSLDETDFADGIHPNDSGAAKMAKALEDSLLKHPQFAFKNY